MSRVLCAVAAVGLGWASPRAAAEPIGWEYRVTLKDPDGLGMVYLGQQHVPGTGGTETMYLTAPIPDPAPNGGPQAGSQAGVRLFGLSKKGFDTTSDVKVINAWSHYTVEVELTDRATGATGRDGFLVQPSFVVGLADSFSPTIDGDLVLSADHRSTLVIGSTRFDLTVRGAETDSGVWVEADVTVSPAADTPEPATLLMGGLGLGGVAVGRRLRRQK